MSHLTPRSALAAVALGAIALSGCASGIGVNDYSRSSVGNISRVEEGVIVAARPVKIEGESSGLGTLAGAALGGLAGSELGGGDKAQAAGAIAGAIAGGVAGSAIQKGVSGANGMAYTVRKTDGQLITITQGADVILQIGQRVFIEYGSRARLVPQY